MESFFGRIAKAADRLLTGGQKDYLGGPPENTRMAVAKVHPASWTTPDGLPMQARWKGANAVVWWPLKEREVTAIVENITQEYVACRAGTAEYEFLSAEILRFISVNDLQQARLKKPDIVLQVVVDEYKIVSAVVNRPSAA